jgi:hypothetical protein
MVLIRMYRSTSGSRRGRDRGWGSSSECSTSSVPGPFRPSFEALLRSQERDLSIPDSEVRPSSCPVPAGHPLRGVSSSHPCCRSKAAYHTRTPRTHVPVRISAGADRDRSSPRRRSFPFVPASTHLLTRERHTTGSGPKTSAVPSARGTRGKREVGCFNRSLLAPGTAYPRKGVTPVAPLRGQDTSRMTGDSQHK